MFYFLVSNIKEFISSSRGGGWHLPIVANLNIKKKESHLAFFSTSIKFQIEDSCTFHDFKNEYLQLSKKAMKKLLNFSTTHLWRD